MNVCLLDQHMNFKVASKLIATLVTQSAFRHSTPSINVTNRSTFHLNKTLFPPRHNICVHKPYLSSRPNRLYSHHKPLSHIMFRTGTGREDQNQKQKNRRKKTKTNLTLTQTNALHNGRRSLRPQRKWGCIKIYGNDRRAAA